jgi:hypothetical protein
VGENKAMESHHHTHHHLKTSTIARLSMLILSKTKLSGDWKITNSLDMKALWLVGCFAEK